MKNVKIVSKPKQGPILGPPKTNKRLGDISSRYGISVLKVGQGKKFLFLRFLAVFTLFLGG